MCSGAAPVAKLEDPEGYLARRSPDLGVYPKKLNAIFPRQLWWIWRFWWIWQWQNWKYTFVIADFVCSFRHQDGGCAALDWQGGSSVWIPIRTDVSLRWRDQNHLDIRGVNKPQSDAGDSYLWTKIVWISAWNWRKARDRIRDKVPKLLFDTSKIGCTVPAFVPYRWNWT